MVMFLFLVSDWLSLAGLGLNCFVEFISGRDVRVLK